MAQAHHYGLDILGVMQFRDGVYPDPSKRDGFATNKVLRLRGDALAQQTSAPRSPIFGGIFAPPGTK